MSRFCKKDGYSLTEVLLAVGTLGVGMLFIAGVFPVALYFATVASEQTITAVAADEAFAKIRLYGGFDRSWVARLLPNDCNDFSGVVPINPLEFAYPSDPNMDPALKQYYWSALCRLTEPHRIPGDPNDPVRTVQVTVFVSRKVGVNTRYRNPLDPLNLAVAVAHPMPVRVIVTAVSGNVLTIEPGKETFINDGYTIVDNVTGQIYRVSERDAGTPDTIILDRRWLGGLTGVVWVVPPPIGGGRNPCIAIYQKVIRF